MQHAEALPTKLPPSFDLRPFARALQRRKEPVAKRVGRTLQLMIDAYSAFADLEFATELLATIREDDERGSEEQPYLLSGASRGALLNQVILMYVRATSPGSERVSFEIKPHLSAEQRIIHTRIVELRRKAVAHFDRDNKYGSVAWADERLVMVWRNDDEYSLRVPIRRVILQDGLESDLAPQLASAMSICRDIRSKRTEDAYKALGELFERHPDWLRDISKYPFDALSFFNTLEEATRFFFTTEERVVLYQKLDSGREPAVG